MERPDSNSAWKPQSISTLAEGFGGFSSRSCAQGLATPSGDATVVVSGPPRQLDVAAWPAGSRELRAGPGPCAKIDSPWGPQGAPRGGPRGKGLKIGDFRLFACGTYPLGVSLLSGSRGPVMSGTPLGLARVAMPIQGPGVAVVWVATLAASHRPPFGPPRWPSFADPGEGLTNPAEGRGVRS